MKSTILIIALVFIAVYPKDISGRNLQQNRKELAGFNKSPAYYDVRTWKVDPEDIPHIRVARATRRRFNNGFGSRFRINNNDLPSSVNYQNSYDRFPTVI